jgi:hypothetical protein
MRIHKAADFEYCSHDRWETAPRWCTDEAVCVVCNALSSRNLETDRLITPTTIKNCFVKSGFSIDHVNSNDENAVKVTEDEDDWHNLQPLGVLSEDYPTLHSALMGCGIHSVD